MKSADFVMESWYT